ncbi:MAG: M42 family peptidase [Oscillospiraceae bacterium]|nr:M42 family peptidase [Oscillospiraceae bacterium]
MKINKDLLKRLCLAFGPSGNEDEVRDIIISEIKDFADDYYTDKTGNLIAFKKGLETPGKKRLFSAHMDEVGFMITDVFDGGYLKFKNLGGIESSVILGKRALIGGKRLPAVFGGKPVHLIKKEERGKIIPAEDIYLDIGIIKNSGEDSPEKEKADKAEKAVEIGEFAVFKSDFSEFGQNKIKCKALDDRFGCCVLIQMLRSELSYDSYFAFTVCEEIGLRGAKTAANIINAGIAVILEATTAGDIYNKNQKNKICSLGKGAVISIMDNSAVYNKRLVNLALETADKNNIRTQIKQSVTGGNDSGAFQKSGGGAEVLAVSLPTRYIHSPSCAADYGDMDECLKLAFALEKVLS